MEGLPQRSSWWSIARVVIACVAILLVGAWWLTLPRTPDAFFFAPSGSTAARGTVIRMETFTRGIPQGARGFRLLYHTRTKSDRPTTASALVVMPVASTPTPFNIVAWAHGTTGVAQGCAPSLFDDPFHGMRGLTDALQNGWVVVATDYPGLGTAGTHAYLVGEEAANAVLDSVIAAQAQEELNLSSNFVIWGHSQGGHSALWAGMRAANAPSIKLKGVAAMAPASDLPALIDASQATGFGKLVSAFVYTSYRATYPDVDDTYVGSWAGILVADISRRCLSGLGALWSVGEVLLLPSKGIFSRSPLEGSFGYHLSQNVPTGPIAAPLLIAQGLKDDAVLPEIQRSFVEIRCKEGQPIDYREYEGLDHMGLVSPGSPLIADLINWTEARFSGAPYSDTCQ